MASAPTHDKDDDLGIGHPARAIWKRMCAVFVTHAAFAGGALALCSLVPPVSKAETQFVAGDRQPTATVTVPRHADAGRAGSGVVVGDGIALRTDALPSSGTSPTGWLEAEIADLRRAVTAAEEKLATVRASSLPMGPNESLRLSEQLSEVESELSRVRATRAGAEERANLIRKALDSGRSLDGAADGMGSQAMQALGERQTALRSQIADLSTTLLDNHPRLRALRSQLRDLDREVASEAAEVQSGKEAEAEIARRREIVLLRDMARLKAELARVEAREDELRSLERTVASQSVLLESYLTQHREVLAESAVARPPVRVPVHSEARTPAVPSPSKILPITAAAGMAGFLLAALSILVVEIVSSLRRAPLRQRTESREADMRASTVEYGSAAPPPLRFAPASRSSLSKGAKQKEPPITTVDPNDLAEAVLSSGIRCVLLLEAESGERSFGSVELARALAARGAGIVVLELGTDRVIGAKMGVPAVAAGLSDLLAGTAGFADVIHRDLASRADAIGCGSEGALAFADPGRLAEMLAALGAAYDCTVIDGGTLTDASLLDLLDEDAAVVVSVRARSKDGVPTRLRELRAAGQSDVLLMLADLGSRRGTTEAA